MKLTAEGQDPLDYTFSESVNAPKALLKSSCRKTPEDYILNYDWASVVMRGLDEFWGDIALVYALEKPTNAPLNLAAYNILNSRARQSVPPLLECLWTPTCPQEGALIRIQGLIRSLSEKDREEVSGVAVPLLIEMLRIEDSSGRLQAVKVLQEFGGQASVAISLTPWLPSDGPKQIDRNLRGIR